MSQFHYFPSPWTRKVENNEKKARRLGFPGVGKGKLSMEGGTTHRYVKRIYRKVGSVLNRRVRSVDTEPGGSTAFYMLREYSVFQQLLFCHSSSSLGIIRVCVDWPMKRKLLIASRNVDTCISINIRTNVLIIRELKELLRTTKRQEGTIRNVQTSHRLNPCEVKLVFVSFKDFEITHKQSHSLTIQRSFPHMYV